VRWRGVVWATASTYQSREAFLEHEAERPLEGDLHDGRHWRVVLLPQGCLPLLFPLLLGALSVRANSGEKFLGGGCVRARDGGRTRDERRARTL